MKKFYIISFLLLISTYLASASPITPEKARSVALKYMNCSSVTLCSDSFTLLGTKASSLEAPAYYVFNAQADGWVIISGEDTTIPVLAVGDKGKFVTENMPEHVKYWMERMSSTVRSIRQDASIKQSAEIEALWANPRPIKMSETEGQVYLETPNWGQDYPYNNSCPSCSGGKGITGCVATATAEVLRYYWKSIKNQLIGKGTIPEYTTNTEGITMPSIDINDYVYDLDIPFDYSSSWTTKQKDAVATLMLHIGCMLEMDYTAGWSGTNTAKVSTILSTYFNFSKATHIKNRDLGKPYDWLALLKTELNEGRPVIYSASDLVKNGGGHAFVCDGYDTDNKIHINWGWDKYYNGWFAVNYLGPASGYIFSSNDLAVIGLVPDPEGKDEGCNPSLIISVPITTLPDDSRGFTVTGNMVKGETFSIAIDAIYNNSSTDFDGQVKFCITNQDNEILGTVWGPYKISFRAGYYYMGYVFNGCSIPDNYSPAIGDYIAFFSSGANGSWNRAHTLESPLKCIDKLNMFDFTMITLPSDIHVNNIVYPAIALRRNIRMNSETWKLDGITLDNLGKNNVRFIATEGEHTLEVKLEYTDGSSETVKKKFTVN